MPRLAPVTKTDFPAMITSSPHSWFSTVSAIQMPQCREIGLRMCAQFLDQPASVLEGERRGEGREKRREERRKEGGGGGGGGGGGCCRGGPPGPPPARASGALL